MSRIASYAWAVLAGAALTTLRGGDPAAEAAPRPAEVRHARINLAAVAAAASAASPARPRMRRAPRPRAPDRLLLRRQKGAREDEAAPKAALAAGESTWPIVTFTALLDNDTSIPPDTSGAVGPAHVMTALNSQIRIQTRTGTTIATVSPDDFWASVGGDPFDPKVLYDASVNRWILVEVADAVAPTSSILLGVSATSDPTGDWDLFSIDVDASNRVWGDFPSVGFNRNWIAVTLNMFRIGGDGGYERADVYVFDKAQLLAGGPARFTRFSDEDGFTLAPAVTHDAAVDELFLVEDFFNGFLRISKVTGPVGSERITFGSAFARGPRGWEFSADGDILPQLGSPTPINGGDARIRSCVLRNGMLWATHAVALPMGNPQRTAVQWWQFGPGGNVAQFARIDDPGASVSYCFPSLDVNRNDDVLIGFSRFSPVQFASANLAYREGGDPPSTLRPERVFKEGEASYEKFFSGDRNRWGDYSATVVDPLNDVDMWTIQEYAASPGARFDHWGTQWAMIGGAGGSGGGLPPVLQVPSAAQAVDGQPFQHEVAATGTPPFTFAMVPPDAVPGLSLVETRIVGTPTTPGTFEFDVTASNDFGNDSKHVTVTVLRDDDADGQGDPVDPDDDDDGFDDAIEQAFGTDPLDAASTPCGGTPFGGNRGQRPRIASAAVRLDFAAPANDSVVLAGSLRVPEGFSPEGARLAVEFGGILRLFTLDARGAGRAAASETCALKVRRLRGAVPAQSAAFKVALRRGSFADALFDEGLQDETVSGRPLDIRVVVFLDTTCSNFQETRMFRYTAREGVAGRAKVLPAGILDLVERD